MTSTQSNTISSNNKDDIAAASNGSMTSEKETTSEMLQRWYKLLFTKEDYLHHHKILGILVISSFLFRFILFFFYDDMGFQAFPYLTVPTILLHASLNLSSFQFKIPVRRIRDGGRIWPQYRYHALIFAMRSLLLLSLRYYEDHIHKKNDNQEPERFYFLNYVIIMCAMGAAEFVNYAVGEGQRSNTVRELDGNPYGKFFFSAMQFNATAVLVIGTSYMVPFYALFTLQITPFIGTLRRKLIFTSKFWGGVMYGAFLVGGFTVHSFYYQKAGGEVLHLFGRSVGFYAALVRFTDVMPKSLSILQDKFVIWTVAYMVIHYYRSIDYDMNVVYLRIILAVVIVLLGLTARHKVQLDYYPKDVKDAKLMKVSDLKSA